MGVKGNNTDANLYIITLRPFKAVRIRHALNDFIQLQIYCKLLQYHKTCEFVFGKLILHLICCFSLWAAWFVWAVSLF